MLSFLQQSRKLLNQRVGVCIVIGNESCDLDSAVCALGLAFFYHQQRNAGQQKPLVGGGTTNTVVPSLTETRYYLPVLNIPRHDYPLKTEVQFLFKKYAIPEEHLTFRDDLRDDFISASEFILVDHHVSSFVPRCVEIFDHRPLDTAASTLPIDCDVHMEMVGSCATLVGEIIAKKAQTDDTLTCGPLLDLLRATIILDTINFSAASARATPKDHEVCAALERLKGHSADDRAELFQTLCKARADISTLTPLQLLHKDLKILTNASQTLRIALPGFPLPVQQFIHKPNAAEAVREFARAEHCRVVLLMGLYVSEEDGSVQRDLGLIELDGASAALCEAILRRLLISDDPTLCLHKCENGTETLPGHYYRQKNIRATRKHILPLIKQLLDQWPITE